MAALEFDTFEEAKAYVEANPLGGQDRGWLYVRAVYRGDVSKVTAWRCTSTEVGRYTIDHDWWVSTAEGMFPASPVVPSSKSDTETVA